MLVRIEWVNVEDGEWLTYLPATTLRAFPQCSWYLSLFRSSRLELGVADGNPKAVRGRSAIRAEMDEMRGMMTRLDGQESRKSWSQWTKRNTQTPAVLFS